MFRERRPQQLERRGEHDNYRAEQTDPSDLLAELLSQQPLTGRPRKTRRAPRTSYERVLARSALVVALLVAAGVWWVGARFTLDWLRSTGVAVDALGLLAWGFPLAITALEMGMLVARSRIVWAWLFWGGVLIFDIYTTAVGLMLFVEGRELFGYLLSRSDATSWVVACAAAIFIAVAPEPAARSIWREVWQPA